MTHARIPDFAQPIPVRLHVQPRAVALARPMPRGSYFDLPDEHLPGEGDLWHVVAPVRPDTAHVRAPRFVDLIGEALTGLILIAGGVLAYGFMPSL